MASGRCSCVIRSAFVFMRRLLRSAFLWLMHAPLAHCNGQQVKSGFSGGAVIGLTDAGENSCFSTSTSGNWLLFHQAVQPSSPWFRLL